MTFKYLQDQRRFTLSRSCLQKPIIFRWTNSLYNQCDVWRGPQACRPVCTWTLLSDESTVIFKYCNRNSNLLLKTWIFALKGEKTIMTFLLREMNIKRECLNDNGQVKKFLKYCEHRFYCHGTAYPSLCKQENWHNPLNPAWSQNVITRGIKRCIIYFPNINGFIWLDVTAGEGNSFC